MKKFPKAFNEPMENMYHWHLAYADYPVVNINKEAADLYCSWRTAAYNSIPNREHKKVVFPLPTEKEWVLLAAAVNQSNLPWPGNSPYGKDQKTFLANIKVKDTAKRMDEYYPDGFIYTSGVGEFPPAKTGLYNIIGNVAELTQNGNQKGGSWDTYVNDCKVDKTQNYELPDPRVGFRVIMEVIEE